MKVKQQTIPQITILIDKGYKPFPVILVVKMALFYPQELVTYIYCTINKSFYPPYRTTPRGSHHRMGCFKTSDCRPVFGVRTQHDGMATTCQKGQVEGVLSPRL